MSDQPSALLDPLAALSILAPGGAGSPAAQVNSNGGGSLRTSAGWPVTNLALYWPIMVKEYKTVYVLGWYNGTAVSGNLDCGIYDNNLKRLASTGSTLQAGVSQIQSVTLGTPLVLRPGLYYIGGAMDNTTGTILRSGTVGSPILRASGCFQQTTAFPLPATAVVAAMAQNVPMMLAFINSVF